MACAMSRRNPRPRIQDVSAQPPGTPRVVAQRFSTKAWELWTGPRDGAAVDTVRIVERAPRTATLRPQKGIPRARGC